MASSTAFSTRFFFAALMSAGLIGSAMAQQANDRCEGTLCDLYYGSNGNNAPPAPVGATPLTVPKAGFLSNIFGGSQQAAAPATGAPAQPAPTRAPLVQVGGGGVLGMARGAPQERCGGTLCDFFYGGPSPEEQREAQRTENPEPVQPTRTALAPGAAPDPPDEPRARRRGARERGGVDYARAPTEKPGCVAPSGDPWRCYRK